jgi:thiosulfate dehydrogenase
MAGAFARYPKHMARNGAVVGLADRVNYCFTRSLAGRPLPHDSREMEDILTYLAFLSRGVPVGEGQRLAGADGQPAIPGGEALAKALPGDSARGAAVYAAQCASCHGSRRRGAAVRERRDGARALGPALVRGGRVDGAAGARGRLHLAQHAARPRPLADARAGVRRGGVRERAAAPRLARQGDDWPAGGAPKDVPYAWPRARGVPGGRRCCRARRGAPHSSRCPARAGATPR